MSIIVTGDTHGTDTIRKLANQKVWLACDGGYPNYIIIAGDFGFIWSTDPGDREEQYWLSWLEKKPWETIVVPGNHENHDRILALPQEKHCGDAMFRVNSKVWIARHGCIYTIEGKRIFTFGGARSIDKADRREGRSWWSGEIPTQEDFDRARMTLTANRGAVDIVVSHTAPTEAIEGLFPHGMPRMANIPVDLNLKFEDPVVRYLDELKEHIDLGSLKGWYFGHFHLDREVSGARTGISYHAVYSKLTTITERD